jgi:type IV secretory pathway VirB2 component (pilin)
MKINAAPEGGTFRRYAAVALMAGLLSLVLFEPALAQTAGSNVEGFLQNIVDMLTGNIARLIAIIAVVLLGFSVMFGLLDIRRAGVVILGIVVVFSAAWVVGQITGGGVA